MLTLLPIIISVSTSSAHCLMLLVALPKVFHPISKEEKKDAPTKADQRTFVCSALICPTPHSHTLYLYTLLTLPRAPHPLSGSVAFTWARPRMHI
jgi:hypothetical protein